MKKNQLLIGIHRKRGIAARHVKAKKGEKENTKVSLFMVEKW